MEQMVNDEQPCSVENSATLNPNTGDLGTKTYNDPGDGCSNKSTTAMMTNLTTQVKVEKSNDGDEDTKREEKEEHVDSIDSNKTEIVQNEVKEESSVKSTHEKASEIIDREQKVELSNTGEYGCAVDDQKVMDIDENSGQTSNPNLVDQLVKEESTSENVTHDNQYAHLASRGFTSEIFKVEIYNLPPRIVYSNLKKRLLNLGLKPCKIKIIGSQSTFAFVNFRCEEDRQQALDIIPSHVWKSRQLKIKKADPAKDPMLKKRKQEADDGPSGGKVQKCHEEGPCVPVEERLNLAVTPLLKMPYEKQLQKKENAMVDFLKKLGREMEKSNPDLKAWLKEQRSSHNGVCCQLHPIKPSPVTHNYRNKCEFTIGRSEDGKDKMVGFRLGSYRGGSVSVASPSTCVHIPEAMKTVTQALQCYLQEQSSYAAFNPETNQGHWRQLTMRTTLKGDIMAAVIFHPHQLAQEDIEAEKERLRTFFAMGDGMKCGLDSLFLQVQGSRAGSDRTQHHLLGKENILENLLGMKFQISQSSFFQVNTPAAEVLYSQVADWCHISSDTVLLDVCCGTGTIGLTMAKKVKRVIGIEMCKEAVDDAKANAQLNEIENAEFHCGKAEDVLPSLIFRLRGSDVVAVVDPPRGGLHPSVVRSLRKSTFVKRLVYVSCNPNGAQANIVNFTQRESNRTKGPPFKLIEAVPVDLFPQTDHCELVLSLVRENLSGSDPTA